MWNEHEWNEAWKCEQRKRRHADDAEYWNRRAPDFSRTCGTSPYAATFIEWSGIEEGESVFDMGCGSGTLALPLARAGHEVWAADFSHVMIELMMKRAELDGISNLIHPIMLAWGDDWTQGPAADIPVCDLAFASRSIATDDLLDALNKFDTKARRRACITLSTGASPRYDDVLARVMDCECDFVADYIFAVNILWQQGKLASIDYIRSFRQTTYSSKDQAIEKYCKIFDADEKARARLVAYCDEHMICVEDKNGKGWQFDHVRSTCWAFIAWDHFA